MPRRWQDLDQGPDLKRTSLLTNDGDLDDGSLCDQEQPRPVIHAVAQDPGRGDQQRPHARSKWAMLPCLAVRTWPCERGCLPFAVRTFGGARLRGLARRAAGMHFQLPAVPRANICVPVTVCGRGPKRRWPVGHNVEIFVRCKCHHDIRMGGDMLICANQFLKRATVRPRRVEQMKEILTRISW